MASTASNSFNVGIVTPAAGTSVPTVQDERNTYILWGWTGYDNPAANPAYDAAPGYSVNTPDIHSDTEGDDVWSYLQAFNRRTTGRNGYLARAQAWRNYYVNSFAPGRPEYNNDVNFLYDHFYGWGLQQYATQFSDTAAQAKALTICTTLRDWWAQGGRSGGGNWPVAGSFDMATYGHRGPARNLHTAVAIADATFDAKAIELRDRLIDLWLQSPDWQNLPNGGGMYWVGSDQMHFYNLTPPDGPLSYAAGDRAVSSFHIGQLAEAFFAAYLSPNVTAQRKTSLRAKIVAMATWMRENGLHPTVRYCSNELGILGSGGAWWNYALGPINGWDGAYTVSIVNLLVMGYKFTGDRNFLDATPANNLYPAKYCFERGIKNIFGSTTAREAPDGVVSHYVDTRFDTSTSSQYLYNNKGELQYTYLIFENGGSPTLL